MNALIPLRDLVLFIKHNQNAEVISRLSDELISAETNVDNRVRDM
ncbi:MAG: DUF2959 family protein [Desulfatitalea sp.]|nr:DUF2959 family protein [Desulfatitalea sp.]